MGKIVLSQNISLDGVVQDPTGEEGTDHGGWFETFMRGDRTPWAEVEFAEAIGASAVLWGRRTHEYFAPRWADRDDPWAERLRELPKYIVSSTPDDGAWANSTVLTGDVVDQVSTLKWELDGEILVYGSRLLASTLLDNGLVDEVRLIVFPVILGDGERLFDQTDEPVPLRLLGGQAIGEGLFRVVYEVVPADAGLPAGDRMLTAQA